MLRALLLAITLGVFGAAHGEVISPAPEKVAVTIYRSGDGLAFVRETRTLDLPAGRTVVRFRNVADPIIAQSAAIDGLPEGAVERNFDYDLLSARALIEHAVGAPVRLVRTNPVTGVETSTPAILRAGPNGALLEIDGKIEALRCSGAPERIVFDSVPQSLQPSPTLSALINAPTAGRYTLRLSYLTRGLTWQANYVARLHEGGETMTLTAWVTLTNDTDTTFGDAPTEVIAGAVSRVNWWEADRYGAAAGSYFHANCWPISSGRFIAPPVPPPPPAPMAAPEDVVITGSRLGRAPEDAALPIELLARQRELADYKLYALPVATTVAAHQTKQVYFLDQRRVNFKRLYQFDLENVEEEYQPSPARLVLRMTNTEREGLGKPLPGGTVNVFEPARGGEILLGEDDDVEDVAIGTPLDWELSDVPSVFAAGRVVREEGRKRDIEIVMTNAKSTPVEIELARALYVGQRIVRESKRHSLYRGRASWTFRLPAGRDATLKYTIEDED